MRLLFFAFSLFFVFVTASQAQVVRPAPDFSFQGVGPKAQTLKGLHGQPVVLLITTSPKNWIFRFQVFRLKTIFQEFANKQVVFAAAFTKENAPIQSDIPFVTANDGPGVASAYGAKGKFNIVIIGRDGNLDYQTDKLIGAERVNDVIQNSYAVQSTTGR